MSENKIDQIERLEAKNRKEWHDWLQKNHSTSPGVWLTYYKEDMWFWLTLKVIK